MIRIYNIKLKTNNNEEVDLQSVAEFTLPGLIEEQAKGIVTITSIEQVGAYLTEQEQEELQAQQREQAMVKQEITTEVDEDAYYAAKARTKN